MRRSRTRDVITTRYRWFFLIKVSEIAPDVLGDLHRDVLPSWEALTRDEANPRRTSSAFEPSLALSEALQRWGAKHNLYDRWILEVAIATVQDWSRMVLAPGAEPGHREWKLPSIAFYVPPPFQFESWDPTSELWTGYRERLLKALRIYERQVKAKYPNWKKSAVRELDHFDWLVRYQVLGMSFLQISKLPEYKQFYPDTAADAPKKRIQAGVKDKAKRIGLTLRPGDEPGRPRGSRSSPRVQQLAGRTLGTTAAKKQG